MSRLLRAFCAFSAAPSRSLGTTPRVLSPTSRLRATTPSVRPVSPSARILIRAAPSTRPTGHSVHTVSVGAPLGAFSAAPPPLRAPWGRPPSACPAPSSACPAPPSRSPRRLVHSAVSLAASPRACHAPPRACHAPPARRHSPQRRHSIGRGPAPASQPPSRVLASHTTPYTPATPLHHSPEGVSGLWRPNDAPCALATTPRALATAPRALATAPRALWRPTSAALRQRLGPLAPHQCAPRPTDVLRAPPTSHATAPSALATIHHTDAASHTRPAGTPRRRRLRAPPRRLAL
ncbi:hypothetical protein DENSPDRAFT_886424 [Dentipellis sp. KUC8613]|nr:hypothetical protein DENSPDRAFT_886424 [Dentipellis sp. KUC8613]